MYDSQPTRRPVTPRGAQRGTVYSTLIDVGAMSFSDVGVWHRFVTGVLAAGVLATGIDPRIRRPFSKETADQRGLMGSCP